MSDGKIKVGITQGDINGIGYEIIIKTLLDARITELCTPIVYGSPKAVGVHRRLVSEAENFNFNIIRNVDESNSKRANLINVMSEEVKVEIGHATEHSLQGGIAALQAAVQDLKAGKIQALVTAPFSKQPSPTGTGKGFEGYGNFLATSFDARKIFLLMVSSDMRVCLATGNMPLSQVSSTLTKDILVQRLLQLNHVLLQDFLINRPRIAVLSFNPRADTPDTFGAEEQNAIVPALEQVLKAGVFAYGPYPSDKFWSSNSESRYDAILAMYHDQGLSPFTTLSNDTGIYCTCGLPIVHTAPILGPEYDLAGKDKASPDSFRYALYQAIDICKNREAYANMVKNPLKSERIEGEKGSKNHV